MSTSAAGYWLLVRDDARGQHPRTGGHGAPRAEAGSSDKDAAATITDKNSKQQAQMNRIRMNQLLPNSINQAAVATTINQLDQATQNSRMQNSMSASSLNGSNSRRQEPAAGCRCCSTSSRPTR